MMCNAKLLAAALAVSACGSQSESERWPDSATLARSDHTTVYIDFDKINEAYRTASGPDDFKQRVNEIYGGKEVISIAIDDHAAPVQIVTAFVDRNKNEAVDDG